MRHGINYENTPLEWHSTLQAMSVNLVQLHSLTLTASIRANVFERMEIKTALSPLALLCMQTGLSILTSKQECIGQCCEACHQDRTEDWVETLRLAETEESVTKPHLHHEPSGRLQAPFSRS